MINKLKAIAQTDLIKTSFFTSIAVFFKIATGFVLNKIVAVYIGPIGIAAVGQFSNFFGIITTIGSAGINTGIVKYIAENKDDEINSQKIISTSFVTILIASIASGVVLFFTSEFFSNWIFKSSKYVYVIHIVATTLIFSSLNTMLMSILNGRGEVKKYTLANIFSSLFVLILSIFLVVKYKLSGVLIAIVLGQSICFFITLFFVLKCHWFKINFFFRNIDKTIFRSLTHFSIMTLVSVSTGPVALMIIRNYIGNNLSWEEAGYWQGVWTISEVYLMLITSSLGVYYLPRLASLKTEKEIKKEIISTAKIILPIVSFLALMIFLCKNLVVKILFSDDFTPMLSLFKYQLMGDVIKIASWLIAMQMISKRMTKLFVLTEIIFTLTFVILSILFIDLIGIEGVALAFAINYFLYFVFLFVFFQHNKKPVFL
jgi:PST family polysaccharide transporter